MSMQDLDWVREEQRNKKKSSSAVVFRNRNNEWLLLELTYKTGFGLPGGKSEKK